MSNSTRKKEKKKQANEAHKWVTFQETLVDSRFKYLT